MKFKGTIIWVMVLVALAAFVYFYEIKGGEKREQAANRAKKVFPLQNENPRQLVLRRSEETIICQRTDEGWQIIQPVRARGDEAALQAVISNLEKSQIERVVNETGENLAEFGLDSPQVIVELEYESGSRGVLHLGQPNPTHTYVYAQRAGEGRVFLTQAGLLDQVQKGIFDLRDKSVLSFEDSAVSGLILQHGQETVEVRKDLEGWTLEKPLPARGDQSAIEALLRRLRTARVKSFVDETPENLVEYGLHRPQLTVTLILTPDQTHKKLLIGKEKDDQRYAKDESRDPVFLIPSGLVQDVDKSPFDLRDKAVLRFDREQVDQLELISPDRTIICQRDTAEQWQMVAPESSAVNGWKLESILSSLSNLKAESFVEENRQDLSKYGLSHPSLEVILKDQGRNLAVLRLGAEKGEQVHACNEAEAPISLVAQSIVGTLSPDLEELKQQEAP